MLCYVMLAHTLTLTLTHTLTYTLTHTLTLTLNLTLTLTLTLTPTLTLTLTLPPAGAGGVVGASGIVAHDASAADSHPRLPERERPAAVCGDLVG